MRLTFNGYAPFFLSAFRENNIMMWTLVQLTPTVRVQQFQELHHRYPDTVEDGTWLACDGEICWSIDQLRQHLSHELKDLNYQTEIKIVIWILDSINSLEAECLGNSFLAKTEYRLKA